MILLIRMIISKKKASLYILSLSVPIETQYPMLPNGNCSSYFPLTYSHPISGLSEIRQFAKIRNSSFENLLTHFQNEHPY